MRKNENANELIREYFRKSANIRDVIPRKVMHVQPILN